MKKKGNGGRNFKKSEKVPKTGLFRDGRTTSCGDFFTKNYSITKERDFHRYSFLAPPSSPIPFCNFISTKNETSRPRPTPKAMIIQA